MELKDRIENIKTLLQYCPFSTRDTMIVEEEVGLFFAKFFNSKDKFTKSSYDHIYPKISLHEEVLDEFKGCSTIRIDYCYDCDRDGEYWDGYYFNDPSMARYYEKYNLMKPWLIIEYSEIPDNIWEIIEKEIYKKASETVKEDLKDAEQHLKYAKNKVEEFNSLILNK